MSEIMCIEFWNSLQQARLAAFPGTVGAADLFASGWNSIGGMRFRSSIFGFGMVE